MRKQGIIESIVFIAVLLFFGPVFFVFVLSSLIFLSYVALVMVAGGVLIPLIYIFLILVAVYWSLHSVWTLSQEFRIGSYSVAFNYFAYIGVTVGIVTFSLVKGYLFPFILNIKDFQFMANITGLVYWLHPVIGGVLLIVMSIFKVLLTRCLVSHD